MNKFFLYVLENPKKKLYIGHTQNHKKRVHEHNPDKSTQDPTKWTHKNGPWDLIGYETYSTRSEAMIRERQLKAWKSPKKVRKLFNKKH
ncbi:MAG: GIY-YIG nuclease family protein [Opitutales bacterium]|nr:GIY-YIG nuclease family protein [Opitutales bacterium]